MCARLVRYATLRGVATTKEEPLSWGDLHIFGPFGRTKVEVSLLIYDGDRLADPLVASAARKCEKVLLLAEQHDSGHLLLHLLGVILLPPKWDRWADARDSVSVEALTQLLHTDPFDGLEVLEDDLDGSAFSKVSLVLQIVIG